MPRSRHPKITVKTTPEITVTCGYLMTSFFEQTMSIIAPTALAGTPMSESQRSLHAPLKKKAALAEKSTATQPGWQSSFLCGWLVHNRQPTDRDRQ